jgi:hypothetical protein
METEVGRSIAAGVRVRFLVRDADPRAFPQWERVNALRWRNYRGEKKLVSGKVTLIHFLPAVAWIVVEE